MRATHRCGIVPVVEILLEHNRHISTSSKKKTRAGEVILKHSHGIDCYAGTI